MTKSHNLCFDSSHQQEYDGMSVFREKLNSFEHYSGLLLVLFGIISSECI